MIKRVIVFIVGVCFAIVGVCWVESPNEIAEYEIFLAGCNFILLACILFTIVIQDDEDIG